MRIQPGETDAHQSHWADLRGRERDSVRHCHKGVEILCGVGERLRSGMDAQVRQTHLASDGAGTTAIFFEPSKSGLACAIDGGVELGLRPQILGIGVLGRYRLGDIAFLNRPVICPLRQLPQHHTGFGCQRNLDIALGHGGKITDRLHTQRVQFRSGDRANTPELLYRQWV